MTGQNVRLSTLGKTLGDVIHGNIIIAACHVPSSERGRAGRGMLVNTHMEFLSAGFTLRSIEPVSAKMRRVAPEGCASLLTNLKSFAPCMPQPGQQCLLLDHSQTVLLRWI